MNVRLAAVLGALGLFTGPAIDRELAKIRTGAQRESNYQERPGISASAKRPGNLTANHYPSCSRSEAKKFATVSRNARRQIEFLAELTGINKRYGGELRKVRRSMARDKANRTYAEKAAA